MKDKRKEVQWRKTACKACMFFLGLTMFSFSPAFALMVAVPAATPVTTPSATVATLSSLEVQVTVGSVASAGKTVAIKVSDSPIPMVSSATPAGPRRHRC